MASPKESQPPVRADGLQLDEHADFQTAFWQVQRRVWWVYVALIVAALLGLTGAGGPFSQSQTQLGEATINAPRVARWQTPVSLTVIARPANAETLSVALSADHAKAFSLEGVSPEPTQVENLPGWHLYHFAATGDGPLYVVFDLEPRQPGLARYDIRVNDRQSPLTSWIWP